MSTRETRRWKAETLNFSKMLARARQKFLATKKSRFSRIFTFLARGTKNWRAGVRAGARASEFSKSMDFQLSNAVSETFPRPLVIFLLQFEILHENRKKSYRKCPGVNRPILGEISSTLLVNTCCPKNFDQKIAPT